MRSKRSFDTAITTSSHFERLAAPVAAEGNPETPVIDPAGRQPVIAGLRGHLMIAGHPYMLTAIPLPVAADPDMPGRWGDGNHLDARRGRGHLNSHGHLGLRRTFG